MRPLAVLNGIVLGSCVSIAVSLAAVMLVFLILGDEYPRLAYEFKALSISTVIFLALTAIAGASFYMLLKEHPGRWWMQATLWLALAGTVGYFIP